MAEIKFFPLDINYKIRDGKSYVYLYGRTEDRKQVCIVDRFEPYFYVEIKGDPALLRKEIESLKTEFRGREIEVTATEELEKNLLGQKIKVLKVFTNVTEGRNQLRKRIEDAGLRCFEYDVSYVFQYLRDKRIIPLCLTKAEGEPQAEKNRFPVFRAKTIEPESSEMIEDLKVLSFDIETYAREKAIIPEKNPVLMIAFQGKDFRKVLTWKRFQTDLDYIEFVEDERELINRFKRIVEEYGPDILTGYFSDGFDLPYLKRRAEKYGLALDLSGDYSDLALKKRDEYTARFNSLIHLDVFKFIRNVIGKGLETDSLSLNAVANELLGHSKHDVNLDQLADIWDSDPEKLEDFCKYNLQDAFLTYELCIKLMPSMTELVKLINLPLADISRMSFSRLVENYIIERGKEINLLAANRPQIQELEWRRRQTYEGSFVYEPEPNIYENLAVFDFRSLYPTVIASHNISPETLNCRCCRDKEKVPGKDLWFCRKKEGFFSDIVKDLVSRRMRIKEMIKIKRSKQEDTALLEARSYGLKTVANSFYGYMGFFAARWYSLECVQSITAYARDYIKKTMEKASEKGFKVVYGDTDSLMVKLGEKTGEEAFGFMEEINNSLPEFMELEFEGFYPRGIFVSVKGGNYGAKKKYALFDGEKVKVVGFESVRRNWSKVAKETQDRVLKIILKENDVEKALSYVNEVISDIRKGNVPLDKVVIKMQLNRPIEQYESIGPHVAIAKKMQEKGYDITPGMVISFIVGKGGGLVREKAKMVEEVEESGYDSEYYVNNQIIPAVSSIFNVLGYSEESISNQQKTLGDF